LCLGCPPSQAWTAWLGGWPRLRRLTFAAVAPVPFCLFGRVACATASVSRRFLLRKRGRPALVSANTIRALCLRVQAVVGFVRARRIAGPRARLLLRAIAPSPLAPPRFLHVRTNQNTEAQKQKAARECRRRRGRHAGSKQWRLGMDYKRIFGACTLSL